MGMKGNKILLILYLLFRIFQKVLSLAKLPRILFIGLIHYPIITCFHLQTVPKEKQSRRLFKKPDIIKRHIPMSENILILRKVFLKLIIRIDEQVQGFVNAIQEAIEISMLQIKICYRSKLDFDQECKTVQIEAQKLFEIFN